MGVMNGFGVQPSMADEEIRTSMQLLATALNEHIQKCRSISDGDRTKVLFHQMVDFILADWFSFFLSPKYLKYKKIFQRALGIQPQLAQLDEESFDIDRHQHDLECLIRIASSIKRPDVELEIRKKLPYQVNNATLNHGTKIKEGWVKLKEEGKHLIEKKEWAQAMFRFSQAIYLNSEESTLYCFRAMCEIHLSKFQLAIEDAQNAIELNPKSTEFRKVLSEAYLGLRPTQTKFATKLTKSSKALLQENQQKDIQQPNNQKQESQQQQENQKQDSQQQQDNQKQDGKQQQENQKCEQTFPLLQREAEKGLAEAQYRLGRLLIYGDGCARHELTAKKLLLKAHAQGFKPKELKNATWVDDIIRHAKSLVDFESGNNINISGLSLAKRIERFSFFSCFNFDSIDELLDSAIKFETRIPAKEPNSIMKPIIEKWMPLMMKRAKYRSFKAQSFFIAHGLIIRAKKLLLQNQTIESFKMLREARRLWGCPIIDTTMFFDAAEEMLKNNLANAEAYHVLIFSNKSSSTENKLWLAMQSVEMDPSVPDFHYALARVYGDMGDYQRALRSIDRALQFSMHSDWLYERASLIRLSKVKPDFEVICAFETYLSYCPPDDFHVPDAHYSIALAHYAMSNSQKFNISLKKGQKAESSEIRLPCFLSVSKSGCAVKENLKRILKRILQGDDVEKKIRISEVNCVVCSKGNPLKYCLYCRKWVCGRDEHDLKITLHDCQVSHVNQHKSAIANFL